MIDFRIFCEDFCEVGELLAENAKKKNRGTSLDCSVF